MLQPTAFSFPTEVVYGPGTLAKLASLVQRRAAQALVVTDPGVRQLPLFEATLKVLRDAGVAVEVFSEISPNPTDLECEAGGKVLAAMLGDQGHSAAAVVGVGGGSALDAAKGIALMATHTGRIVDYDDAKGGWEHIRDAVPPVITVPTTAGTGSEVGRSTVVVATDTKAKVVVFSPHLMPVAALIDPEIMVGLPAHLTAATGFDALTHNLEAWVAKGLHPMADGIALEGLALCAQHLARAVSHPTDLTARGGMALAAMMGAVAFQKGLGAAHSLAHPLSSLAGMHHGLANAVVLDHVIAFNREGSSEIDTQYKVVERRLELEQPLEIWVKELRAELGLPGSLTAAGISDSLLDALADQAFEDACHQSNPRPCTRDDLLKLYAAAFAA